MSNKRKKHGMCDAVKEVKKEDNPRMAKWIYIIFPDSRRFKVPAEKIAEAYIKFMGINGTHPEAICSEPDLLIIHMKECMQFSEIRDMAIRYANQGISTDEQLFKLAYITTDAGEAGAGNE